MKSIYERMVDIIRKHYPSACYITPATIYNGNIEVQFYQNLHADTPIALVYYGNNKFRFIYDF